MTGPGPRPMFKISTIYLDPEARHADVQHGTVDRGNLDAARIAELLENFRAIDAMETIDLDPQIIAIGRNCRLIIRVNRKRLFAYNAQDMNEAATEMTPAEILQRLENVRLVVPAPAEADQAGPAPAPPPSRRGIGYALIVIAMLINIYTTYSIFAGGQDINDKSDLTYATDPVEIAHERRLAAGTYATGAAPGDRILQINADGSFQNSEIGAPGNPAPETGTYRIAAHVGMTCLSVDGGSVIDVVDHNTLLYYQDTYRRIK